MVTAPAHDAAAIAEIAKGLTKAQRKGLLGATYRETSREWRCNGVMHPAGKNLRVKGLVNGVWDTLTPLGLAVRASLAQSKGEE